MYDFGKNIIVLFIAVFVLVGCVPRQKIQEARTVAQSHATNYDSIAEILRATVRSEIQARAKVSEKKAEEGTRYISEVTTEFNDSIGAPKKRTKFICIVIKILMSLIILWKIKILLISYTI